MLKRKKAPWENNHSKRQRIEFALELENITAIDDSVEPEVQMRSQDVIIKIEEMCPGPGCPDAPSNRTEKRRSARKTSHGEYGRS